MRRNDVAFAVKFEFNQTARDERFDSRAVPDAEESAIPE
jgi:hypothetical protein